MRANLILKPGERIPMQPEFQRLWNALAICHGPDRAESIFDGNDPETNADLAKWRALGSRREGAA